MRIPIACVAALLVACGATYPSGAANGGGGDGGDGSACACDATSACDVCGCDPDCPPPELECLGGHADCYPAGYCDEVGSCEELATLADCHAASASSPAVDGGPVLFGGTQVDLDHVRGVSALCSKDPDTCANNGNVCAFELAWYDPDGDVAVASGIYPAVRFLRADTGAAVAPYNVVRQPGDRLHLYGCWDEATTAPGGAAILVDDAGHRSNPVCFEGRAP